MWHMRGRSSTGQSQPLLSNGCEFICIEHIKFYLDAGQYENPICPLVEHQTII